MSGYFTKADMDQLVYYQVPKVLITGDRYKSMKSNAKLLYITLIDRMKLSMKNEWCNDDGHYYVRMSVEKGAELLGFSEGTFKNMKKELKKYDLLDEDREGQGRTNRLFLKHCSYSNDDVIRLNNEVDDMMEEFEDKAQSVGAQEKDKNCLSREAKIDSLERQNLTTSNNNLNKNKTTKNEEEHIVNKDTVNNDQEIIDKLVLEYMKKGLSKDVCLRVVEEIKQSTTTIHNLGGYLRAALEKSLYRSNYKKGNDDPHKYVSGKRKKLYHDWLNEG